LTGSFATLHQEVKQYSIVVQIDKNMTKKEFLNFISNGKEDVLQQLLDLLGFLGLTQLTQ